MEAVGLRILLANTLMTDLLNRLSGLQVDMSPKIMAESTKKLYQCGKSSFK